MSPKELESLLAKNRDHGYPDVTDQHKMFAHEYILDFDHNRAAAAVGYSRSNGIRMLRDPLISAFIEELKQSMFSRMSIDADMVRAMWIETIPKLAGKEAVPKMLKDGSVVEGCHFDGPSLVSALKDIGTMTDLYKNGSGGNQPVSVSINLGDLGLNNEQASQVTIESTSGTFDEDGAPV